MGNDGVSGTRLTLLLKKKQKTFKWAKDIKQLSSEFEQLAMTPGRKNTNEMSPTNAPAFCLRLCGLTYQRERTQAGQSSFAECKKN